MRSTFLTARWENLIMANYIIDPAILIPHLPNGTTLDLFNGNAYVSLVGFHFMNTKLFGLKIPFHADFEEVNLRFYVQYNDSGLLKRGTVFIKEIVPRAAISFIANTIYHEKYSTLQMKHMETEKENEISFAYYWKYKNKWNKLEAAVEKKSVPVNTGSEEEFIAEHYWGYSKYKAATYEYQVQHPKWEVYPLKHYSIDCDFTALYGEEFSILASMQPASVFVAKGSDISVLSKRKL